MQKYTIFEDVDVFYCLKNVTDTVTKLFQARINIVTIERYDRITTVDFLVCINIRFKIFEFEYVP